MEEGKDFLALLFAVLTVVMFGLFVLLQKGEKEQTFAAAKQEIEAIDRDYEAIVEAAKKLFFHVKQMDTTPSVRDAFKAQDGMAGLDKIAYATVSSRLAFSALDDAIRAYKHMDHRLDLDCREGHGLAVYIALFLNSGGREQLKSEDVARDELVPQATAYIERMDRITSTEFPTDRLLVCDALQGRGVDEALTDKYVVLLYRFMTLIAKADGTVTQKETDTLAGIMAFSKTPEQVPGAKGGTNIKPAESTKGDAIARLQELIGLDGVKNEIVKLSNFIRVQQLRKEKGMKTSPISYHCVFTGNPGTGKTTVARLVSEIYRDLGILKKGHLVETDRAGLVAEYTGQTAPKTNKIIDKALDGVLFIDEAYSLVSGDKSDFGIEAIATLLKRMEDDRDRLVVILAGYSHEMQTFIDTNPGLQSRFNRYIHFDDYSADDLLRILHLNIKKYDYRLTPDAEARAAELFRHAVAHKDKNFGNGRYARNVLEKTLENQATRLAAVADLSEEALRTIEADDIPVTQ